MLLKLFKKNHPYVVFLIPIIGVVLWIPAFFANTNNIDLGTTTYIFNKLYNWININSVMPKVIALLLIIVESFILVRLNFKYIFIEKKTYLPSVMFLIFASAISAYQTLHPLLIGNLFLLLSLDKIFIIDKKRNALKRYFESGFFLGLGAIFYPNIYVFTIIIWLTLFILRTFNWREWFTSILGVIAPFFFYLVYLFLTDNLNNVINKLISIFFYKAKIAPISGYPFYAVVFLAITTFLILFKVLSFIRIKKINTRKYFSLFFWFLIYTIVLFSLHQSLGYELIVVIAIPLSIIYSMFLMEQRSKWIGEVLFSLILISIFIMIWG